MTRIQNRRGLRTYLGVLVLVGLVPTLVLGILAIAMAGHTFRNSSGERLIETAQALSHAVDSSIADDIATLRLLSQISRGEHSDKQATVLLDGAREDQHVRILELASEQEDLPRVYKEAIAAQGPYVSNLLYPENTNIPEVAISVPMEHDPSKVLAMLQPSNHLIHVLRPKQTNGQELLVAVLDSSGHIAARSRSPEKYLGRPVPDWSTLVDLGTEEGLFRARTKEGGMVVFAFHKLSNAPGWALVVGQPLDSFDSGWKKPLRWMIAAWCLTTILALLMAQRFSERISKPMKKLVDRSRQGIRNAAAHPLPADSSIREIHHLQESLAEAEQAIYLRTEQLEKNERRYRALAEDCALVLWRSNGDLQLTHVTGWRELTGQNDEEVLQHGFLQSASPEDAAAMETAWQTSLSKRVPLDIEFRVLSISGQWRWVRCRGTQVKDSEPAEWIGVLEDADARRQAQARIAYLAHHDALTGLSNRTVLNDRLHTAMTEAQRGRFSALLCLDLDRFKEVNDTLGHPVGDALLIEVASRLKRVLRENDLIVRLGGDEFALLLNTSYHPSNASHTASRIIDSLSQPFELREHRVQIGVSIGIALIDSLSQSPERLMQNADLALYRAKGIGRGCYCYFEQEMDTRMQMRRNMELELRSAIENGEFELYYQPIVTVHNEEMTGCEALLRWNHPRRGLLLPIEFLDLAEEIGLMPHLGRWIVHKACHDANLWPESMKVAVNLSSSQLAHPSLYEVVESALIASHLSPSRLELEITENALMEHIKAASASLLKLKVAGVSVVMDDFGTGQSSLGYLRAFPFDKVKIDKSFIQELGKKADSDALVSAITHLCHRLGIKTTVEGIETIAQLNHVRLEGCNEAQGLLFGGAMPVEEFTKRLHKRPQAVRPVMPSAMKPR